MKAKLCFKLISAAEYRKNTCFAAMCLSTSAQVRQLKCLQRLTNINIISTREAKVAELVDAADSKSAASDSVWVRVPSLAPLISTREAKVAELVDAADSKSAASDSVWVRVPSLAPLHKIKKSSSGAFFISTREAKVAELVDAADSKSAASDSVWVRVPSLAPLHKIKKSSSGAFFMPACCI